MKNGLLESFEIRNKDANEYIIKNWQAYDCFESAEECREVLNILQAHGENLETMHDFAESGCSDFFCAILFEPAGMRDVVEALKEFNQFIKPEDLGKFFNEYIENMRDMDYDEETIDRWVRALVLDDDFYDECMTRTNDGYIFTIWC